MSPAESSRHPLRLWPEPWASHAAMRIAALRGELTHTVAGRTMSEQENATANTVAAMLDQAEEATHPQLGRGSFRRPLDRWRGTSIERAQYFLHAARIAMVDLMSDAELAAYLPPAMARLDTCLAPTDVRRAAIEKTLRRGQLSLAEKRAALKSALKIGYDASDQLHQRIRGFRNILITVGATILIFMAAMIVVVAVSPDSVPLCFEPSITASQVGQTSDTASTRTVCPSGEEAIGGPTRSPSPEDVAIVAGLGLLGGSLAAALAIRNLRGTSLPYDVPLALAFLKVPMGALTAVVGILLLGGGFVPGLSELDSQRQILAYALLLGFAQQVGTQLIDKQAQSLLNSVPSKDPEAKQPSRPAPVPDQSLAELAADAAAGPSDDHRRPTRVRTATLPG
jgi:hypothetical protein